MTRNAAGNSQYIKRHNRSNVLNLIRKRRAISRIDIAKETKLTPTAVTLIINGLMKAGVIREAGVGVSTGGRKPVILEINPEAFYTVGVDIEEHRITLVIVDFTSRVLDTRVIKNHAIIEYDQIISIIYGAIENLVKKNNIPKDKVLGIGVGVTGQINREDGVVYYSPNFGWENVSLAKDLGKYLPWPVIIDNESRATAMGELWVGMGQGISNFININGRTGIGSGIFIHGDPYYGITESAGEVGHTTVNENGPKCSCGNTGCLETYASTPSIEKHMIELIKEGKRTAVLDVVNGDLSQVSLDIITQCARDGDDVSLKLLMDTGKYIGTGIANLINILNPTRIILGGDLTVYGDLVLDVIKNTVSKRALVVPLKSMDIVISEMGRQGPAIGASTLVLWEAFKLSPRLPGVSELL